MGKCEGEDKIEDTSKYDDLVLMSGRQGESRACSYTPEVTMYSRSRAHAGWVSLSLVAKVKLLWHSGFSRQAFLGESPEVELPKAWGIEQVEPSLE